MPSRLSSLLVRDGLVGVRRMEKAFQRQVIYGGSLDTILLELAMVPEERLCQYLALASGLPPASRAESEQIDATAVTLLELEAAQAYRAIPLVIEGEAVRMAVCSPIDLAALEDLADQIDRPLRPLLVPEYRWHLMLARAYGVPTPQRFVALAAQVEKESAAVSQPVGRARTIIVENEPERDTIVGAVLEPIARAPERAEAPERPAERPTERGRLGRITENLSQPGAAPTRPSTPGRAGPPPPPGSSEYAATVRPATHGDTPRTMRRRVTLIGVNPVQALADLPAQGDFIPISDLSPASGIPTPIAVEDVDDDRPTAPRQAQADADLTAVTRRRPTAPLTPTPASAGAGPARVRLDTANAEVAEVPEHRPGTPATPSQRVAASAATEPARSARTTLMPAAIQPAVQPRRPTGMTPSPLATAAQASQQLRSILPAGSQPVPRPVATPSPSRASGRASTAPIHLPADTTPVTLREARELLATAEHRDDVFIALLRAARHVMHWAGLLTIHGGAAIGRVALAQPELDAEQISSVLIPLDAPSPVRTAMTSKRLYVGPLSKGDPAVDSMFLRMGGLRPPALAVLPLVLRDRVVAMVVGHRGERDLTFADVAELVPLAALATEAIGRLILRHKTETGRTEAPSALAAPVTLADDPALETVPPPGSASLATPVAQGDRGAPAATPMAAPLPPPPTATTLPRPRAQRAPAELVPDPDDADPEPHGYGAGDSAPEIEIVSDDPGPDDRAAYDLAAVINPRGPERDSDSDLPRIKRASTSTMVGVPAGSSTGASAGALAGASGASAGAGASTGASIGVGASAGAGDSASAPVRREPSPRPATRPMYEAIPYEDLATVSRPDRDPPASSAPALVAVPIEELLDLVEDRDGPEFEAAIDEAIARAAEVLPVAAERFPGALEIDRYAVSGRPLRAAQYGGLLELITRLGSIASDLLIEKMTAPARDVRFYATVCLTEIRPRNAIPALIERLFDPDFGVRACALEALQGYPVRDLESGLTRARAALHSDDAGRVAAAAAAMAELGDREAIPDLIAAMERGERYAEPSRRALMMLTKQDFGTAGRRWQRWWEDHQRRHRLEWMIDGLAHKESELRASAIADLRRLTGESFGYEPELPKKDRDAAHRRWLTWWNEAGRQRFVAHDNERHRPTALLPLRRD